MKQTVVLNLNSCRGNNKVMAYFNRELDLWFCAKEMRRWVKPVKPVKPGEQIKLVFSTRPFRGSTKAVLDGGNLIIRKNCYWLVYQTVRALRKFNSRVFYFRLGSILSKG
jgi:hypothetical protein